MAAAGGFLPSSTPAGPSMPARPSTIPRSHLQPLSEKQVSALIRHFDMEIDKLIGGMKARLVSSPFSQLAFALRSASKLLNDLLAIPPFGTVASIRTAYLLRFTGDVSAALSQYDLATSEAKQSTFAAFDLLDRGWLCCLRAQVWDAALGRGVSAAEVAATEGVDVPPVGAVSQTERARLLSLALRVREGLAQQTRAAPVLEAEMSGAEGPATDLDIDISDSDDDDVATDGGLTAAQSVVGATSLALGAIFARTLAHLDSPGAGGPSLS